MGQELERIHADTEGHRSSRQSPWSESPGSRHASQEPLRAAWVWVGLPFTLIDSGHYPVAVGRGSPFWFLSEGMP